MQPQKSPSVQLPGQFGLELPLQWVNSFPAPGKIPETSQVDAAPGFGSDLGSWGNVSQFRGGSLLPDPSAVPKSRTQPPEGLLTTHPSRLEKLKPIRGSLRGPKQNIAAELRGPLQNPVPILLLQIFRWFLRGLCREGSTWGPRDGSGRLDPCSESLSQVTFSHPHWLLVEHLPLCSGGSSIVPSSQAPAQHAVPPWGPVCHTGLNGWVDMKEQTRGVIWGAHGAVFFSQLSVGNCLRQSCPACPMRNPALQLPVPTEGIRRGCRAW